MFIIEIPPDFNTERAYILSVLLDDWLGIPWSYIETKRDDVLITLPSQSGEIRLPDVFFRQFRLIEEGWLSLESLPQVPLATWDTRELAPDILLTNPIIPVILGDSAPCISRHDTAQGKCIRLPVDILGAAFFMLSRYEEAVLPDRDKHDRFPASASVAYRADFLDRPIVDEYLEILWTAMRQLWPGLNRKQRQARTLVSCDVDTPFAFNGRLKDLPRRMVGDLLKRHSPRLAVRNVLGELEARKGLHTCDPYRKGLDFIMEVNERVGRSVAFYFIPENTDSRFDNRVSLDDPRMREMLREIHARGHEIGIHPGYNTYKHPEAMARSVLILRRVLEEEGIDQPQLGGRQHYLRWVSPTTARLLDENGLDYDATLSFVDQPGFRCGTCFEYPAYDFIDKKILKVKIRPLIAMEVSVINEMYMGLGLTQDACDVFIKLKRTCYKFNGQFSLLWHNNNLSTHEANEIYESLLSM